MGRGDMEVVLVLLISSAVLGFAAGLLFRVFVLVVIAFLIACASAFVLQSHGFSFRQGVPVTVACLFANQIAYLFGVALNARRSILTLLLGDSLDNEPGQGSQRGVRGDENEQDKRPPWPPSPER